MESLIKCLRSLGFMVVLSMSLMACKADGTDVNVQAHGGDGVKMRLRWRN
jgi:hypothetical protein